ncbi:MAG: hypothetical protein ACI4N1_12065 [Stenotrophomonas koreensis]|uniref:hypothetical protein n=1 Tax=Stenotrophomonas koreensis TaxID=266128 RepID=UPI003395E7AC
MKALPRLFCFSLLALALYPGHALAQRSNAADLQQQMSPEQFRAAGLDKLSPAELAALNAWLQGRVEQSISQVREQALEEGRQEVIVRHRGFLSFGSDEPIVAVLPGRFSGFAKGRQYLLDNGQVWEQTDDARLSGASGNDRQVRISPGLMGAWYLQVDGINTRAKVRRVK